MISRLRGTLLRKGMERVEVATPGGVVYEVEVPVTVAERLPEEGGDVEVRTVQVVREDSQVLYGFLEDGERRLFLRLLSASGVGGRLALAMLSTFRYERLARALAEKDLTALSQVSGVGKKKAERIALELADKVQDLAVVPSADGKDPGAEEAVRALVTLGFSFQDADAAVRSVLAEEAPSGTDELIRKALARDKGGAA